MDGRCPCGARFVRLVGDRARLYWNDAGKCTGFVQPPCTRKRRTTRKPTQLALPIEIKR